MILTLGLFSMCLMLSVHVVCNYRLISKKMSRQQRTRLQGVWENGQYQEVSILMLFCGCKELLLN